MGGRRLRGLWRLGRPLFLLGGVALYGLGVVMALGEWQWVDLAWVRGLDRDSQDMPNWGAVALGQITVTAAQLLTHFTNDYHDRAADAANSTPTRWSGGSRALVDGVVSVEDARRAAWVAGSVAVVAGVGLVLVLGLGLGPSNGGASVGGEIFDGSVGNWAQGTKVGAWVAIAIFLAWAYSSPPVQLHSRGLGEVMGALLLAGITPIVGLLAAGGRETAFAPFYLAPLVLLQFAMLVVVSLPDRVGDMAAGKKTLAVRFGGRAAGWLGAGAIGAALVLALGMAGLGDLVVIDYDDPGQRIVLTSGLAYLYWWPVGFWVAFRLLTRWDDEGGWEAIGFWSIVLVMGSVMTVGAAWMSWMW